MVIEFDDSQLTKIKEYYILNNGAISPVIELCLWYVRLCCISLCWKRDGAKGYVKRSSTIFNESNRRDGLITHSRVFHGKMRIFSFMLGMLMVLAGMSSCLGGTSSGNNTTTQTGPVKIGISLSLTGHASGDGPSLKQAYQLWPDYINHKGLT